MQITFKTPNDVVKKLAKLKASITDPIAPFRPLVVGPGDLAIMERIRDDVGLSEFPNVPTDIFVLNFGKTNDRTQTQVGSAYGYCE